MNTDERHIDIRLVPGAVTCWTVTAAGILWSPAVIVAIVVGAVAGTAMAGRWCARRGIQLGAAGVAAVAVIGTAFGLSIALRAHDARHHPIAARHGHTATVGVVPTESPRSLGQGRIMFRGGLLELDGNPLTGMVLVFAPVTDFAELTVGRPATFRARIGRPLRPDLSVAVLTAIGEPTLGAVPTVRRLSGHIRSEFADTARRVLPAEQSAMLPALVLGDMSAVPATTADDFKIAGLTHLTAVSGANVTIVCGTALLVAALVGPRLAALLALAVLIGFVVVVEPSASVLRAAVMGGIALLAVLTHRRRQAIPVLSASVVALMAVAPQLAVDAGFALSVVATAALVVIAPTWSARLVERGWPTPLAAAVSIALAAQLVTAPLIAGISGRFSVLAVLANLLVAAVIPPITVIGTVAAALSAFSPQAAGILIRFTGPELWWLLTVADRIAAVPGASVTVPSGFVGMALVTAVSITLILSLRRRWGRMLSAAAACCLLAWTLSGVVGAA
ncbi:MAG: ComEC/Rec2 family competence protein [Mycolicibacterium sp.]|nr:ComEC/Rec2 family competence protein [Mycolicibacterium sp.]